MTSKRWSKPAKKHCTKREEKEILGHMRKIKEYRAWLETRPESDERDAWIKNCDAASARWKKRYQELVTK